MKLKQKLLIIFIVIILIQVFFGITRSHSSIAAEDYNISKDEDYENYSEAYKEYLNLSDEEKEQIYVIPRKYDVPLDSIYENSTKIKKSPQLSNLFGLINEREEIKATANDIPKTYNLRDKIVIPKKDQGSYGLCAVFSCIRSVETNLALHKGINCDLSELHVDYITSDNLGIYNYGRELHEDGVSPDNFKNYCIDHYGPVFENDVPYSASYSTVEDYGYLKNIENKVYITEFIDFPTINKSYNTYSDEELELFRNKVKKHIMENGSIYSTICSKNLKNINGNTTLYSLNTIADHAISIIGWDDNYSRDNFKDSNGNKPEKDGAYIAVNSWGDNDIIYISYETDTIEREMFGVVSATLDDTEVVETWDVSAEDGESNVIATLYANGKLVISGNGKMKDYEFYFHGDESIAPYYTKRKEIKALEIEEGITSIGKYAFQDLEKIIDDLTIANSVESIGWGAFEGCNRLETVTLPSEISTIEGETFRYCGRLKYIKIPEKVGEIGLRAFESSGLTRIDLSKSVAYIDNQAFDACNKLEEIIVDMENSIFSSENGVLFNKEKTKVVKYPLGKYGKKYIIPDKVIDIEGKAFEGCFKLEEIVIPNKLLSIGYHAFADCMSLKSINMPDSIEKIQASAFYNCSNLKEIYIPKNLYLVSDISTVFERCNNLTNINVSDENPVYESENGVWFNKGKTQILKYPPNRNETKYIIPNGVTKIEKKCFEECNKLINIEIPDSVENIEKEAFYLCLRLRNFKIPDSVKNIERGAFNTCRTFIPVSENEYEIEVPDIIKRVLNSNDVLYAEEKITLKNCNFNDDKSKLILSEKLGEVEVSIKIESGPLSTSKVMIVPSGTVIYSNTTLGIYVTHIPNAFPIVFISEFEYDKTTWENEDITGVVYLKDGERVINNNGKETYLFKKNGEFIFKYINEDGEEKEVTAKVDKLDKDVPIIENVEGNPQNWTNQCVTLKINVTDELSGIYAYSFDGGNTWQAKNESTYTDNKNNIIIKVMDIAGNIAESEPISITKIDNTKPKVEFFTNVKEGKYILQINAEDQESGVKNVTVNGNNAILEDGKWVYDVTEGEEYKVKVIDNVGNITESEPISITKIMRLQEIKIKQPANKTEYEEGEDFNPTGMKIEAKYDNGQSEEVSGYEIVNGRNLQKGQTSVRIRYTEKGETKEIEHAITVVQKKEELRVEVREYETIKEEGKNYIENIKANTTIEEIKSNIRTNGTIEIYKGDTKITENNKLLGTGMEIRIKLDNEEIRLTAIVKGDMTGDGKMSISDLLRLSRYAAGIDKNISIEYLKASDVVEGGKYGSISDIVKMSRVIANMDSL